ncbi:MAG: PDZ domain-containing protein [Gemmataceae bacterium]
MSRLIFFLFLSALVSPPRLFGDDFYVSPSGSDTNNGSQASPFATLAQAQKAAREASSQGKAVTVFLRDGTHYLEKTLTFTPQDSGTKESPVTYKAFENEKPVVSGGVKLDLKWTPFRDGIFQAKVPEGFTTDQLFVNGVRQSMARYPNFKPDERIYNGYAEDCISPERVKRWADPTGGFIHAMHAYEWGGYHFLITGKKADGTLTYEGGWQNNRPSGMHSRFRFVENIFEELDAPGEWFLNTKTNTLYFYPPANLKLESATFEAARLRHLFEFQGTAEKPVHHVTLSGLTIRHSQRTFMDNREPLLRSDWTTYRGGAVFYTGCEDCSLVDCLLDQVGGNAVFVNGYNRRITVRGCHITQAGANGVAFVGSRDAGRVPRDWKDQTQSFKTLDRTPGPKTNDYPADCLVDDCLIDLSGRVEKQTAPVQIELAESITVRHCSLYDCPRAGINIGDGCWGGHVIEFCDVFDTVKETGDHGSFNSWGRDRFWNLNGLNLNDDKVWEAEKKLPLLDAVKTITIRNSRWRCDHGWDIDLDDGSSNYHIYNNLCLRGGLKNREGFYRVVENNIIINNGFHPHVWYKHSQDIVRKNIFGVDHYLPAGGMPSTPWGKEMDDNLVHQAGVTVPKPATRLAQASKRDSHSLIADARFVDPAKGDFRVQADSPALKLGFVNFPMDQFGVQKPSLKAIARTPVIPPLKSATNTGTSKVNPHIHHWQGLRLKALEGEEYSVFGVAKDSGGMQILSGSHSGLEKGDLIASINGKPVKQFTDLLARQNDAAGKPVDISAVRNQQAFKITMTEYRYTTLVTGTPSAERLIVKSITTKPEVSNESTSILNDGKLAENYGPVFANGTTSGLYKIDLGKPVDIAEIKTWSFNQNGNRGSQSFSLWGSASEKDPGWNLDRFTAIHEVDTTGQPIGQFQGTRIHNTKDRPLGRYRWLVWSVQPVTALGENTAYQELEIIPAKP